MFRISIAVVCSLFAGSLLAVPTVISGTAASYIGKSIVLFEIEDYLSEKKHLLQAADINDVGEFNFTFEVTETRSFILSIQRVESVIYVEPGKHYFIEFPSDLTADFKRFDKTEVEVAFLDLPKSDINNLIRDFNADYISFINEHFYDFAIDQYRGSDAYLKSLGGKSTKADLYKGVDKNDSLKKQINPQFNLILSEFTTTTNKKYEADFQNVFFRDYVKYSLGELELMGGMGRNEFYADYFMSSPVLDKNPAYMHCFSIFYENFLLNHKSAQQALIIKAINIDRDPEKLIAVFENDSSALSATIRTMAVIKGLVDNYYNKTYTFSAIEKTLGNIKSSDPMLRKMAANCIDELKRGKEGWKLDDFILIDEKEDKWHWSEQPEMPHYILYFATWNSSSLKELQLLQKLYENYNRDIAMIAICMDENFDALYKHLQKYPEQKFTFLFGGTDPVIVENCAIRSLPHAIMLDEEGKVMYANTKKPSEGVQAEFEKIRKLNASKPLGPKTWKN